MTTALIHATAYRMRIARRPVRIDQIIRDHERALDQIDGFPAEYRVMDRISECRVATTRLLLEHDLDTACAAYRGNRTSAINDYHNTCAAIEALLDDDHTDNRWLNWEH